MQTATAYIYFILNIDFLFSLIYNQARKVSYFFHSHLTPEFSNVSNANVSNDHITSQIEYSIH